jgi:4-amino-4-deoxy-L-arabinose transferase-like glycosyltransferase
MTHQTPSATLSDQHAALSTGSPRRSTALLILTGLWLIIFFAALFTPPLLDDADATHANAARHMALSGDLVTLRVNGIRYLEKAPLPYWLVAASFRIFGFNAFAAHLPQSIGVLLLAFLGFHWAERAYNARAALYSGLAILTSVGVFLFTRYFIPEVLLSLFLAISLYTLLRSLESTSSLPSHAAEPPLPNAAAHKTESVISTGGGALAAVEEKSAVSFPPALFPYLLWTSLALAVLTKGLVALVFFLGAAIPYLILSGEYKNWRALKPFTGALLFLVIAAPWHILAGLRNTGGMNGHGFFWFYFINEHVLRFLGRRYPRDYNKLPGSLFWSLHLVWLFPWSLFCGTLIRQATSAFNRYTITNPMPEDRTFFWQPFAVVVVGIVLRDTVHIPYLLTVLVALLAFLAYELYRRQTNSPAGTPLIHTPGLFQQTTLLLSLFASLVLVFFSLSTNQEYYTFPAYLPILLLLAAALTLAEQNFASDRLYRRSILIAHAAFTVLGALIALALAYGLWSSRHLPYVPDIGELLAHRDVGNYTLSMSHFFDLTGASFAALRTPAIMALLAFAVGPAAAWLLRLKHRHLAASSTVALTATIFLVAAHIAFARFGPMLSSHNLAVTIQQLEATHAVSSDSEVLLYGDQAYGSSIPFYLGRQVSLVEGRSSSMIFGSTFPDAPPIFLTGTDLLRIWGHGQRKILFVPLEKRDDVDRLLGSNKILLKEASGKALYTDRPLDDASRSHTQIQTRIQTQIQSQETP